MKRSLNTELATQIGKKVLVKGWLHNLRALGKINFLLVRDRSGLVQIVVTDAKELKKLAGLQEGTVLAVTGKVNATKNTDLGVELVDPEIEVLVPISAVAPVVYNKKEVDVNLDTQLDYRPLVLRNPKIQAIFKVQAMITRSFGEAMRELGFTEFRSPVLMGAPSESGADVFEVKYFDQKAFLAQSPQVYKQIMVGVFERAYTIATVFRAEKHNTSRHLMEITQMDGEMGFIEDYDEVHEVVETVLRHIFTSIAKYNQAELALWGTTLPKLPKGRFPKIKVREALELIEKRTGKSAKREDLDVDPEDEREISKWALEEHGSDFVWLLNFKGNKNFYTWDNPDDSRESLSYDLECRGLEWLSGTFRIHDYKVLLERFKKQGLTEAHYQHYLQAFEYGMPAEAGFSLGLERMTKQIFQLENVREATLFPSDLKRVAGQKIVVDAARGAEEIKQAIKRIFVDNDFEFQVLKHEPTPTSEAAAKVRDLPLSAGVKALILREKRTGKNILVAIPADKKLNFKKFPGYEFEKPELILERYGLKVGGVPPFGEVFGLETFVDARVFTEKTVAFNNCDQAESLFTSGKELEVALRATHGEFAL